MSENPTSKLHPTNSEQESANSSESQGQNQENNNSAAKAEEDDEFEDFPVEDWGDEDTDMQGGGSGGEANTHLWEESWDDDDTSESFAVMLKEELKKVDGNKR